LPSWASDFHKFEFKTGKNSFEEAVGPHKSRKKIQLRAAFEPLVSFALESFFEPQDSFQFQDSFEIQLRAETTR
jgi:hypothetical protein